MTQRFMSAADFRAALALLAERGISANQLHKIFECGSNQPRRWARIGAPRYVALALAAVLDDIPPWTPPQSRRASRMKGRPVKRLDA
jgi:hypothetical protein